MPAQQLSFLSAGVQNASVADLAGLLLGPGQLVRMGGTARLSAVLDADWRGSALFAELVDRGVLAEKARTEEGMPVVRTAFLTALGPLAKGWLRGAVKAPPRGFALDGPRLRLWAIGAGQKDRSGYLLKLSPHDEQVWPAAGPALAAAGLAGTFLGPRADGPAYRITGRRRMARLAGLVGEPPPGSGPADWPA